MLSKNSSHLCDLCEISKTILYTSFVLGPQIVATMYSRDCETCSDLKEKLTDDWTDGQANGQKNGQQQNTPNPSGPLMFDDGGAKNDDFQVVFIQTVCRQVGGAATYKSFHLHASHHLRPAPNSGTLTFKQHDSTQSVGVRGAEPAVAATAHRCSRDAGGCEQSVTSLPETY